MRPVSFESDTSGTFTATRGLRSGDRALFHCEGVVMTFRKQLLIAGMIFQIFTLQRWLYSVAGPCLYRCDKGRATRERRAGPEHRATEPEVATAIQ